MFLLRELKRLLNMLGKHKKYGNDVQISLESLIKVDIDPPKEPSKEATKYDEMLYSKRLDEYIKIDSFLREKNLGIYSGAIGANCPLMFILSNSSHLTFLLL